MNTSTQHLAAPDTNNSNKTYSALVLDSGAFLSDTVAPTSLLSQAQKIYTTPHVIAEIKDPHARSRLELQWLPFLNIRTSRSESVEKILHVASKSGDKEVLSSTDVGILALALELETELRGHGNWLRSSTGVVKTIIGGKSQPNYAQENTKETTAGSLFTSSEQSTVDTTLEKPEVTLEMESLQQPRNSNSLDHENNTLDDDEGWITPSNIRSYQLQDESSGLTDTVLTDPVFVACATYDFAMQNVLLQLPIPVVTPNSPNTRITSVRSWLLRCHACFFITRVMSHQFCPRCGGPTLLRTSYSTDATTGETKIFLKRNFQWNKRGNVYSIPKPTGGRASGKEGQGVKHELLLRGDQKEYVRQKEELERINRKGERDLMDKDYLPGILTGERGTGRNKVQIGYGRTNPNAKKSGKRK